MSAKWADWVWANADKLRMGTVAHHQLGDISRDNPDTFIVREEFPEHFVGEWMTGFGFVGVVFPKATSRLLTTTELDWLAAHEVGLA